MKIYQDNGYVDIRSILAIGMPFTFILGGRGTGKTYTALKICLEDHIKIMLMRRTQGQTDMINKSEFNPYKPICDDEGLDIEVEAITKSNSKFVLYEDAAAVRDIGYTCALSTISNMRGFDASDVDLLLYDEFIQEKSAKAVIKYEGDALLNAYETINRNRELQGRPPLRLLAMANAFELANPIFVKLGLVNAVDKAWSKGWEYYIDKTRGILCVFLSRSAISEKKASTALYKLVGTESDFAKMSINNDFSYDDHSMVMSMPLKEWIPMAAIDGICIYKHKSKSLYYVSEKLSGSYDAYTTDETDLKRFVRKYGYRLHDQHLRKHVIFESFLTKAVFEQYIM